MRYAPAIAGDFRAQSRRIGILFARRPRNAPYILESARPDRISRPAFSLGGRAVVFGDERLVEREWVGGCP